MSRIEKIKRLILVVLGLSLSAYLIYSGFALLSQEDSAGKVHSDAVK
jgi:hypothetical protein